MWKFRENAMCIRNIYTFIRHQMKFCSTSRKKDQICKGLWYTHDLSAVHLCLDRSLHSLQNLQFFEFPWRISVMNFCDEFLWQVSVTSFCDEFLWQISLTNFFVTCNLSFRIKVPSILFDIWYSKQKSSVWVNLTTSLIKVLTWKSNL